VKPAPFEYLRPASLDEALAALAAHGGAAKPLAGGQSLVPAMNFRIAQPAVLVDLNHLPGLDGIDSGPGGLRLGAMVRHRALETSAVVGAAAPLVAEAMPHVAHLPIRTRGTLGGSLAHADPAAELPAVMIALDASVVVKSSRDARRISASDFVTGPFTTSLEPGELVTEIAIPEAARERPHGFVELARRRGDFALAGACCTASVEDGVIRQPRIVLFGVGPAPIRAREAESALEGAACVDEDAIEAAARSAAASCEPSDDVHASAAYRRRIAAVITRRALARIGGEHG
jgi:carbon-monoxide dehydrogenase medium subunit